MIYNRGQPADLDHWAQRGNRGWGYADCLPYYRRSENRIGFGEENRGRAEGGIPVTDMDWINPVSEAFIAGCVGMGIPRNPDYNSGDQAGVGYFQRAIQNGRRVSRRAPPSSSRPAPAPISRSAPMRGPAPSCSRASAPPASATSPPPARRRSR